MILGCMLVNTSVVTTVTRTVSNTKSEYLKASMLAIFQIKKITFLKFYCFRSFQLSFKKSPAVDRNVLGCALIKYSLS